MVCDKLKKRGSDGKRKALSQHVWQNVLEHGLRNCEVARLEAKGTKDMVCVIKAIPTEGAERINYHNALMQLCGLSLRELLESMQDAKVKDSKRRGCGADGTPVQDLVATSVAVPAADPEGGRSTHLPAPATARSVRSPDRSRSREVRRAGPTLSQDSMMRLETAIAQPTPSSQQGSTDA
jgi:hypothetical protein